MTTISLRGQARIGGLYRVLHSAALSSYRWVRSPLSQVPFPFLYSRAVGKVNT